MVLEGLSSFGQMDAMYLGEIFMLSALMLLEIGYGHQTEFPFVTPSMDRLLLLYAATGRVGLSLHGQIIELALIFMLND
jgi:hypothetical protein